MPEHHHFADILERTTGIKDVDINAVADGGTVLEMGTVARQVPIADTVRDYMINIVLATHPDNKNASKEVKKYLRYGASPRAAQTILMAARIKAILGGRFHVAKEDINSVAIPALRHRLILSFEGQAEGMTTDKIIEDILKSAE